LFKAAFSTTLAGNLLEIKGLTTLRKEVSGSRLPLDQANTRSSSVLQPSMAGQRTLFIPGLDSGALVTSIAQS
jgi:hypothetical protein